jgi:hypothetical protein
MRQFTRNPEMMRTHQDGLYVLVFEIDGQTYRRDILIASAVDPVSHVTAIAKTWMELARSIERRKGDRRHV